MNHRLKVILPSLILLAAILACNFPGEQIPAPGDVQTAAALTVQAVIAIPSSTGTNSSSAVAATPSRTGAPSSTVTITPTYSAPMLTVRESTNCRAGPGEAYQVVFTYLSGKKLEIVGRYEPGNFWLVKSKESTTGTCWLWGEYVDVTGSYWAVSSVTPPPTTTSAPPRAPSLQKWDYSCSGGNIVTTILWKDMATGETGYRVFRNDKQVVELPADSTAYTDTFDVSGDPGQTVKYYVQVYGPSGTVNSSVISVHC